MAWRPNRWVSLALWIVAGTLSGRVADAAAQPAPGTRPDPGVVYYVPGEQADDAAVVRELATIRGQGYRHINLSSWVWTLPTSGSPLRRRVELILRWCDEHDMGVWLLHNVQYGGGEYGDLERAVKDPVEYVRPVVTDWIDVLRGHRCVRGVQLGNEVGPAIPSDAAKAPGYAAAFHAWLRQRYGTLAAMNAAWGAKHGSFDDVGLPAEGAPGRIDLRRFARAQFGRFYGAIFTALFKPALGAGPGYTAKTAPDPYLYREFPEATVLGWDDLVANQPLWTLRVLADCDPRPPFDDEIHLYHDSYQYFPSAELTRYRYFTDALTGQWMSSSFAWGGWNKPEIAAIHAATPRVLADLERLAPELRPFAQATRKARIGVLVTEPLLDESGRNVAARPVLTAGAATGEIGAVAREDVPLEDAYAALAATGRPWRYVLDLDLPAQGRALDSLIVPGHAWLPLATLRALVALPRSVRVEWAGEWPAQTEYGRPLPADLLDTVKSRSRRFHTLSEAGAAHADPSLAATYREQATVSYGWWSPERGHYTFGVRYPRVEARRAQPPGGATLVALINHTREEVRIADAAALPWRVGAQQVTDLTAPATASRLAPGAPIVLAPFDVRLYRYDAGAAARR